MQNKLNIYVEKYDASLNITLPCLLTKSEMFVLSQLLQGKTQKEIALDHDRSTKTISSHKRRLYKKLGISNDITLWLDIIFINNKMMTVKKKR